MITDQVVVLGFDYGERRIGVAVGQTLTGSANPLDVVKVRNHRPDWKRIEELVRRYEPDALVLGLPQHADGSAHKLSPRIHRFERQLRERFRLPVYLIDERLSSYEAAQRCDENVASSGLDAVAAQVILETWLHHGAASAPEPLE